MSNSLDEHLQQTALSDVVAEQFFKDYGTSSQPMQWAGRPQLGWTWWLQMGILVLVALGIIGLALYVMVGVEWAGVTRWLRYALAVVALLLMLLVIIGVVVLSRSNLNSFYAFDTQHLYWYNRYRNRSYTYPLAILPDFVADDQRADGTTTLRCSFRKTTYKERSYKTPVLYCLVNGRAVLDLLKATQNAAKLQALEETATPAWLPLD
jgi:phosphoglycerol transferase MdoB-like AlkP superfamily enzyme